MEWFLTTVLGGIVLFAIIMVGCGAYMLYESYGLALLSLPLILVVVFSVGHITVKRLAEKPHYCEGCKYLYHNMFSEYLHKRRCLPYITASVGRK